MPLLAQASQQLSSALTVLSAMITPAVLILGSSSLIAATSTRLGRLLERIRKLSDQVEAILKNKVLEEADLSKYQVLFEQLQRNVERALLLQRAMTSLYLALGGFSATSIALGVEAAIGLGYTTVLVILGLVGAGFLFYASVLLVIESRVAITVVHAEMEHITRLTTASLGIKPEEPTQTPAPPTAG